MNKLWRWARDQEWAVVISVVAAIVVELPALVQLVQGEISDAGKLSWQGLPIIAAGIVIRGGVWCNRTKREAEAAAAAAAASGQPVFPTEPFPFPAGQPLPGSMRRYPHDSVPDEAE